MRPARAGYGPQRDPSDRVTAAHVTSARRRARAELDPQSGASLLGIGDWQAAAALEQALVRVATDDALRVRLAAGAEASASAWDWDRLIASVLGIFDEAVAEHGRST